MSGDSLTAAQVSLSTSHQALLPPHRRLVDSLDVPAPPRFARVPSASCKAARWPRGGVLSCTEILAQPAKKRSMRTILVDLYVREASTPPVQMHDPLIVHTPSQNSPMPLMERLLIVLFCMH
ncbi:hypothetical protein A0H81_09713 [Grifola frondosa]|uniref:Uncharacterized protein n=1 Tax=Grifola frondosa TaxID=5627 RepID=A0A1C7M008_GRIFR|nr:hypothetical protein A0H81_09713 [Grifola frondosa]